MIFFIKPEVNLAFPLQLPRPRFSPSQHRKLNPRIKFSRLKKRCLGWLFQIRCDSSKDLVRAVDNVTVDRRRALAGELVPQIVLPQKALR